MAGCGAGRSAKLRPMLRLKMFGDGADTGTAPRLEAL
jgi:hypothetical protein